MKGGGVMPKEELEKNAIYKGNIMYNAWIHKNKEYPSLGFVPNKDITYYFDKDMVELGHTTPFNKTPTIFPEGRKWDSYFLKQLQVTKI